MLRYRRDGEAEAGVGMDGRTDGVERVVWKRRGCVFGLLCWVGLDWRLDGCMEME